MPAVPVVGTRVTRRVSYSPLRGHQGQLPPIASPVPLLVHRRRSCSSRVSTGPAGLAMGSCGGEEVCTSPCPSRRMPYHTVRCGPTWTVHCQGGKRWECKLVEHSSGRTDSRWWGGPGANLTRGVDSVVTETRSAAARAVHFMCAIHPVNHLCTPCSRVGRQRGGPERGQARPTASGAFQMEGPTITLPCSPCACANR